jgi:hypothetical protein
MAKFYHQCNDIRCGNFGKKLGHGSIALMKEISALSKRLSASTLLFPTM